jgi:hypothetical protein
MLVSAFLVQIGWAPCGADAYVFGNGALRPSPRLHPEGHTDTTVSIRSG